MDTSHSHQSLSVDSSTASYAYVQSTSHVHKDVQPQHESQSLSPPSTFHGGVTHNLEEATTYSSIFEISDHETSLLGGLLSLTDLPQGYNQQAHPTQDGPTPVTRADQPRYETSCQSLGAHSSVTNTISQYAMDAIFHNLIYPEVCQGQFLTFETLVQSPHGEAHMPGSLHSLTAVNPHDMNLVTCDVKSTVSGPHRQAKRKRSPNDVDDRKRVKSDAQTTDSTSFHPTSASPSDRRRLIVHKRVKELMAHIS